MNFFDFKILNPFRSQTPKGFYDKVKGHTGIDLNCPIGTDLSLPFEVTFLEKINQLEMGLTAYLKDSNDVIHVFAHLSGVMKHNGQILKPNEIFGHSGNSGSATTGPHLHYELISPKPEQGLEFMTRKLGKCNGYNIDPLKYLKTMNKHWSDEAMDWAVEHELITLHKVPDEAVTWGELVVFAQRLAKKIIEWDK